MIVGIAAAGLVLLLAAIALAAWLVRRSRRAESPTVKLAVPTTVERVGAGSDQDVVSRTAASDAHAVELQDKV